MADSHDLIVIGAGSRRRPSSGIAGYAIVISYLDAPDAKRSPRKPS
jgi:hypothetical protein